MSKVISSTSREDLLLGIGDILEHNHQAMDSGYCPWCNVEEYEVDDDFHCDHEWNCPVTMLEQLLSGIYKRSFD